ncbi:MAG TPA: peptidoglycan-binding protein, partial [Povalibacter sp.]
MNRVSGIIAGLLCLAGCWNALAATGPDADPVATAISAELDALMNPEVTTVHGAQVALRERLQDYYSRREFRAAWSNAHTAQQLLQALADSHEDGLDPADYHLPLLKELAAQVAAQQATATLKAQYDLLLTEALLRLSYHLSFGKVDPESFDAKWNYGRTLSHLDVSKEIDAAISSDQVYERIAALKPKHFLYVRLKQELARHRVMEKTGGWSALPAGPALKPGASDARIPALRSRLVLSGDLADNAAPPDPELYDATLVEAVKQYQQRAGLEADGAVGAGTIKHLNIPVTERIMQLRVNLDRGRLLLQDLPAEFVVVNIAGYSVYLVRGEDIVWNARAQVGKAYRRTPLFRSEITYLVWNPT